jgi:hypothetical protein
MKLKYQEELNKIDNCPSQNEKGEKTLFRCVENPMDENSFIPNAVLLKPRYQDHCIAWGISLFNSLETANQMLLNLSKKKSLNYSKVAKSVINDEDGVKHSSKNKKHYTLFPAIDVNLSEKFEIIEEDEK